MKTTVFLARHGETLWTVEDRFNGRTNVNLNDFGRAHARQLSMRLGDEPITAIYSSPLHRCVETATIVAEPHDIIPIIQTEFAELDYGVWDGLSRQEICAQYPVEWDCWVKDPAVFAPPQGESGYAALNRAMAGLWELVTRHVDQVIVIVAHKAINRLILCDILGIPPRYYRSRIGQSACALNCIEWQHGEPIVTLINDTSHYSQAS